MSGRPSRGVEQLFRRLGASKIETHISWVFLTEREAFKIKKPVDLGFLDFRDLDSRRTACEAEVSLNRRLAPDVYLGVEPLVENPGGLHLGGRGRIVEWCVRMRRLPENTRADLLVQKGQLQVEDVEAIAKRLVVFHEHAHSDETTAHYGSVEAIRTNLEENFLQTQSTIGSYISERQAEELRSGQLDFLERNPAVFARRALQGRVRDGHGDLRLEHVYFEHREDPIIIDCIEFNDRFRYADVCADIAFLTMDLSAHKRRDLGDSLLAAYARGSRDYGLYVLVDFYEGYRAFVRAKVASILAADTQASPDVRDQARAAARRHYLQALASVRPRASRPRLIAIGGLIGVGKSTVARYLARARSLALIDSDSTRKEMIGVAPTERLAEPAWQGAYARGVTSEVYAELLLRAYRVLKSGRSVVIDASFRTRELRDNARRLAVDADAEFLFVECRAPAHVCKQRLHQRALAPSVSDGRAELFDDFVTQWESTEELSSSARITVDTTLPIEKATAVLLETLPDLQESLDLETL